MHSDSHKPSVSIVMPVFNGENTIALAISSILQQSFTNFELIVVNDGSTDSTPHIVKNFNDKRIILINHDHNQGIASATNTGFSAVNGEFIVCMDCDDISLKDRIKLQFNFLKANHNIDGCGALHTILNRYESINKIIC